MLKNKPTIVSRLFDTINKMTREPSEAGPSEAGPSEAGPSEAGPSEAEPSEAGPSEAEPSEAGPSEAGPSEAEPSEETGLGENYIVSPPNKNIPLKFTAIKPLMLCIYQVRTDGLYPFILFLLEQKSNNFIALPLVSNRPKKIKYAAIAYLKPLLPNTFTYAGFYESAEQNILILKASEGPTVDTSDDYIWATAFEIVNKKQVLNYPINSKVCAFFHANPAFLTLKSRARRLYESPMIGYYITQQDTSAVEELDIYRETILPVLGKCYYLLMAMPEIVDDTKIMRIVFFPGKMVLYRGKKEVYDTLVCHKKYYIIEHYNQHVLVSVC